MEIDYTINNEEDEEPKTFVRIEIIYSQALGEDFDSAFKSLNVGKKFTKLTNVTGAGYSNPHLGNSIWPQLNEMLIIYCDTEEAEIIKQIVKDIRKQYVTEGVACFVSSSESI